MQVPPDLEYVAIAKWGGWDPEDVKRWDEQTADDVMLYMRAVNKQEQSRRR